MVTRITILSVFVGLGMYLSSPYFNTHIDKQHVRKVPFNQASTVVMDEPKTQYLPNSENLHKTFDNESLNATHEKNTIANAELIMSDSLQDLHLKQFTEYLNGEVASEHTIIAFYTDSRWYNFYEDLGYKPEDIDQLIVVRNQYLSDVSQSGKKYYFHRWSSSPHSIISKSIAFEIFLHFGYGDDTEMILSNSLENVASKYGITTSLVETIARVHLLNSIGEIESASAAFNSSLNNQVDEIKFDAAFVEFLEEQAGYSKKVIVIGDKPLHVIVGTLSTKTNSAILEKSSLTE